MKPLVGFLAISVGVLAGSALAQSEGGPAIIYGEPGVSGGEPIPSITTPPSVDNGMANGIVKHAGSPSVGNGLANGVVKWPGSPSVGDGLADGVAITPAFEQHTR